MDICSNSNVISDHYLGAQDGGLKIEDWLNTDVRLEPGLRIVSFHV